MFENNHIIAAFRYLQLKQEYWLTLTATSLSIITQAKTSDIIFEMPILYISRISYKKNNKYSRELQLNDSSRYRKKCGE